MKIIIETIITSSIIGVIISMVSMYAAKRMVKREKHEIKEEIKTYLMSLEGQQSIASLGQIFAVGFKKGIGLEGGILKGKTYGIPNQLILTFLDRVMPEKGKKAISKENEGSSSDPFGET